MSDLRDAHAKRFIRTVPSYNCIFNYFEAEDFLPILQELIVRAVMPLKAVETVFAVDSSGFATSRFTRWYDHKYGCERNAHDWVKAHLTCGVKTNVVTAIEILGRDANDSPVMPDLLAMTAKTFKIAGVCADKAYSSRSNLDAIVKLNGTPYIRFKTNAVDGDGLCGRMFNYFKFRREEFLGRYHARSNVESTFSMIKAKFRGHVRSKSDTAMANEVFCKVLCHNVCRVIHATIELGIEGNFWKTDEARFA